MDALAAALGRSRFELELDPRAHAVRLREPHVLVPVRYEVHWRRFHTLPTDLVRDAAYLAKRASPDRPDEADCQAFSQWFLREHVLG